MLVLLAAFLSFLYRPIYGGLVQMRQFGDVTYSNFTSSPPSDFSATMSSWLPFSSLEVWEESSPAADSLQSSPTEGVSLSESLAAPTNSIIVDGSAASTAPVAASILLTGHTLDKSLFTIIDDASMEATSTMSYGANSAAVTSIAPDALAFPKIDTTLETAVISGTVQYPGGPAVVATAPTMTVAPSGPSSGCVPYGCNIFYQFVSVYYWAPESQNSACLSSMPVAPSPVSPTGIQFISPSVYAIFPSISAFDGCSQIGPTFSDQTASFPPGALSTILPDNVTQSFNFADLPCPPSSVQWDPSKPYAPLLAPPQWMFDLDPAFSGCIAGASQGVDPPTPIPTANGVSGPGKPGGGHHPKRRAPGQAVITPWAPQKTS